METSELIKKVRHLEIKTKGISKDLFAGEYHSAFKGRGMSFSEVRDYHYGDDVRNIEWNVTARTGNPHIKIFEEERELTVILMVDISPSTHFGTGQQFRDGLINEISAVLAFSAIQNNDKVGLLLFSDQVELFIPPNKGRKHILRIIRELIEYQPSHTTTKIEVALKYFNNVVKKKSICFLLSDFFDNGFDNAMQVVSKKHDLIGLHVFDPLEKELPKAGIWQMRDAETLKEVLVDTSNRSFRKAYHQRFERRVDNLKNTFRKAGADLISIEVGSPYFSTLHKFFKHRMH